MLFLHSLCRVRVPRIERGKERAQHAKQRIHSAAWMKVGRATHQRCMNSVSNVCSTCVTEEFSDFMLCSKTLSSSSTLRARLLVGVAHVCKPKPFREHTRHANNEHIQWEHRTHCSNGYKMWYFVCTCSEQVLKCCRSCKWKCGMTYLSDSSARSSVRSRSPSMMTSLRATFRCSTTKCYNTTSTVDDSDTTRMWWKCFFPWSESAPL